MNIICLLTGHRVTQHTYGAGITYIGHHCWRCKKGLHEGAHDYEQIKTLKGPY
jgi:hypothetical protein